MPGPIYRGVCWYVTCEPLFFMMGEVQAWMISSQKNIMMDGQLDDNGMTGWWDEIFPSIPIFPSSCHLIHFPPSSHYYHPAILSSTKFSFDFRGGQWGQGHGNGGGQGKRQEARGKRQEWSMGSVIMISGGKCIWRKMNDQIELEMLLQ